MFYYNIFIIQNSEVKSREVFDKYITESNIEIDVKIKVVGYKMMIELCKQDTEIIMVSSYIVEDKLKTGEFVDLKIKNLPSIDYCVYFNKFVNNLLIDEFLKNHT